MTKKDTEEILKKLNSIYSTFYYDDYKFKLWYEELKDYSYEDVNKKLDSHMRSEEYSQYPPQLHFLTKYLTKEKEKGKITELRTICSCCGKDMLIEEYHNHLAKHNAVKYIAKMKKMYFNEETNEEELYEIEDEIFEKAYIKLLERVYKVSQDTKEKQRIKIILDMEKGIEPKYTIEEVIEEI